MRTRLHHSALITLLVLPVAAQEGAAIFHHFHHYPTGQYTTRTEGTVTGGPPSQPNTQTVCISAPSPAQVSAFVQMEEESPVLRSCTMRIVRDEEKTAEYEQTCPHGREGTLVTHMTMSAIDDRTFKTDTLAKSGVKKIFKRSTHPQNKCWLPAPISRCSNGKESRPDRPILQGGAEARETRTLVTVCRLLVSDSQLTTRRLSVLAPYRSKAVEGHPCRNAHTDVNSRV